MARYTVLSAIIAVSMMSGTAFAKNKKSDNYMVVKDSNGQEAKVLKAQFIRPGDVSPEEYARLLAEADRIRAYQAQGIQVQNPATQNVQYQSGQAQYAPQAQYAQPQYSNGIQLANPLTPAPQSNARQLTYNSMSGKKPQTYAEYMAAKRAMLAQAQLRQNQVHQPAQPAPVYVQQQATATPGARYVTPGQPVYVQQQPQQLAYIPAPQPTVRYQPPANNRVIYAAMPDVMGTGPAPQTIVVPAPRTVAGHNVIKGDTLYSLARHYGVKLTDLKAANGLTSNIISVGQVLTIPGAVIAPQPRYAAPAPVTSPVRYQTPSQGTSRYYTRTSTAGTASTPKVIRAVQPVPASGVYAVLQDDTIYSIANFACVNPYDVAKLNGLVDTTNLTPGQKLKMPAGHCLNN